MITIIIKKNPYIVARKIHGSLFLIDISDNYSKDKCALYEINETGMFIWNTIGNDCTLEDIVAKLKQAITEDIDDEILMSDVLEYIDVLTEKHFLEVVQ